MLTFLTDETLLSQSLGIEICSPVRLFDLHHSAFQQFAVAILPSFYHLEWDLYTVKQEQYRFLLQRSPERHEQISAFFDQYYADRASLEQIRGVVDLGAAEWHALQSIRPYRRRSVASFSLFLDAQKQAWTLARRPSPPFTQRTGDYRALPRSFPEMAPCVSDHAVFKELLLSLTGLLQQFRPAVRSMQCICHQMGLVVRPGARASNAPEGIHQDGADYIVSALVIERRSIQGGTSTIYGPDQRTSYLTVTLQPGQGILQADEGSDLWHDVTPIVLDASSSEVEGVRNILGFDFMMDV